MTGETGRNNAGIGRGNGAPGHAVPPGHAVHRNPSFPAHPADRCDGSGPRSAGGRSGGRFPGLRVIAGPPPSRPHGGQWHPGGGSPHTVAGAAAALGGRRRPAPRSLLPPSRPDRRTARGTIGRAAASQGRGRFTRREPPRHTPKEGGSARPRTPAPPRHAAPPKPGGERTDDGAIRGRMGQTPRSRPVSRHPASAGGAVKPSFVLQGVSHRHTGTPDETQVLFAQTRIVPRVRRQSPPQKADISNHGQVFQRRFSGRRAGFA